MFGFSKRRTKLGRLKVQLSDSPSGIRSPIRHAKRIPTVNVEGVLSSNDNSDENNFECSTAPELKSWALGNSENWMVLSIGEDKPTPRLNHAAAVIGNKMVVVGGESANGLLDDVQVLDFDRFSWTTASSKLYLSPSSLPLKIPACKGHTLVSWGKKVLLIGGKTEPASERMSVWAFDTESECWSLMEAKGDVPVARSGHTVVRASSVLILFGGEDAKRRKLHDLHMFDLKSLTWLPLHCTGPGPSARSNHVATLYDDKTLLIFGGTSKSRTLNDLYSLDFETMIWSRIRIRGYHPSPRAGCCGVLCGTKWYIVGGGSRKKRHAEMVIFDVLKHEWSAPIGSPLSSITANKGFSLVIVQHKERYFLVAFGGSKKEPSNQVEVLMIEKNESSTNRQAQNKSLLTSTALATQLNKVETFPAPVDDVAKQNSASAIEHHGSGRISLSESLRGDSHPASGNTSLRKQLHHEEELGKMAKCLENGNPLQVLEEKIKQQEMSIQANKNKVKDNQEKPSTVLKSDTSNTQNKQENENTPLDNGEIVVLLESDTKSVPSSIYHLYETKIANLIKKNGALEAQLGVALASQEAAEKNLTSVLKSRQEMEKKLSDTVKEMELMKEKLAGVEMAQEEANSLSNIVHSDNVRLEHDVAFLKAVLDDTQKELHSTRGVLAGERARAFQLQVEVFHLKQRLQSMETRAPTPRKPFHV